AQSVALEAERTAARVRELAALAAARVQHAASLAADELARRIEGGTALDAGHMAEALAATVRAAADATDEDTSRAANAVKNADCVAAAQVAQTLAAAEELVEREVIATADAQRELATAIAVAVALETDARAAGVALAAREAAEALLTDEHWARSVDRRADLGEHELAAPVREAGASDRAQEIEEIAAESSHDLRVPLSSISASVEMLEELDRTGLVGSAPEEVFDRVTRLAKRLLGVDAAFVSLIDDEHQFLKSVTGAAPDLPRLQPLAHSFCKYAVASGDTFVVRDSRQDPLVRNSPAIEVNDIGAYAGAPLETTRGNVLGTVCVVHHRSRDWTEDELAVLEELAALAVTEIEYRLRAQEAQTIRGLGDRLAGPLASLSDAVRETATLADRPEDLRLPRVADTALQRMRTVESIAVDLRSTITSSAFTGPSVDLGAVLDRSLALAGAHADAGVVEVRRPERPIVVRARGSLDRPLSALLQTAVQHLGEQGRCRVQVEHDGAAVALSVSSPGKVLANATLLRLVSKFSAGDTGDAPARGETATVRRQGRHTVVEHGPVRAVNGPEGFEFRVIFTPVDARVETATR
nr:GAF domain-containing protein [Nocardioides sp.]